MVIHQLLSSWLFHACQRIIFSSKILGKVLTSSNHQLFHTNSLFLGNTRRQSKSINTSANSDSAGVYWNFFLDITSKFWCIHIGCVSGIWWNSVIFLNNRIKDWSKVFVRIPVTSIDTTMLVVKLNSTGNCLNKSESWSFSFYSLQLIPNLFGNMLSNKRMLRLDIWKGSVQLRLHSSWRNNWSKLSSKNFFVFLPKSINSINHLLN